MKYHWLAGKEKASALKYGAMGRGCFVDGALHAPQTEHQSNFRAQGWGQESLEDHCGRQNGGKPPGVAPSAPPLGHQLGISQGPGGGGEADGWKSRWLENISRVRHFHPNF